jgi:hypothetical protein
MGTVVGRHLLHCILQACSLDRKGYGVEHGEWRDGGGNDVVLGDAAGRMPVREIIVGATCSTY